MTMFHLFQNLDRTMLNRHDAHRWRVTLNDTEVEIFRRPVLTSEVTLGALGLSNAPMPVPICVCKAIALTDMVDHVEIVDVDHNTIAVTGTHAAVPVMLRLVEGHSIDDA